MNITGNILSGQVTGETAKQLSERFGKIMQDRASLSINRTDTSISKSKQLDPAIPASKIPELSFWRICRNGNHDPMQKIELMSFHCEIQNDHGALKYEMGAYKPLPIIRQVGSCMIQRNYLQIKQDVVDW